MSKGRQGGVGIALIILSIVAAIATFLILLFISSDWEMSQSMKIITMISSAFTAAIITYFAPFLVLANVAGKVGR